MKSILSLEYGSLLSYLPKGRQDGISDEALKR
jgi:hypothetical protein